MEHINRVVLTNLILVGIGLVVVTFVVTLIFSLKKKDVMLKLFDDIMNSLYSNDFGFSTRKLWGWFAVITCGSLTLKHSTPDNVDTLLNSWLLFAAACIGLVTYGDILTKKINKGQATQP